MDTYEQSLLIVARAYAAAVDGGRGKSLARIATIVANRGSFFDALERGSTLTARNLHAFAAYFRDPANWPDGAVPREAAEALSDIGRPARAKEAA